VERDKGVVGREEKEKKGRKGKRKGDGGRKNKNTQLYKGSAARHESG